MYVTPNPVGMYLREASATPAALRVRWTRPRLWQRQCAQWHRDPYPFGHVTPKGKGYARGGMAGLEAQAPRLWHGQCSGWFDCSITPAALSVKWTRPRLWQRQCAQWHRSPYPFGHVTPSGKGYVRSCMVELEAATPRLWQR